MKKLLYVLCVFILFVLTLGANNSIVPVKKTAERAIPGESFGVGRGFYGFSTDEALEVAPEPEVKTLPVLDITLDSLVSGGNPEKSVVLSKMRAFSDVVDSVTLPSPGCTGSEWNGRYIYLGISISHSDSSFIMLNFEF